MFYLVVMLPRIALELNDLCSSRLFLYHVVQLWPAFGPGLANINRPPVCAVIYSVSHIWCE